MKTQFENNQELINTFNKFPLLRLYISLDDVFSTYDINYIKNENDLIEAFQEFINSVEVIYYSEAIKYLQINDPSLMESLEIAHELNFKLNNISSETLATLHLQSELQKEMFDFVNQFYF